MIRGNHDKVAAGLDDGESFNAVARSAVLWTYEALTPANREYLTQLPAGPQAVDDLLEICHGTPFDEDAYLFDDLDALRAFEAASRPVCLFGHTHVAVGFRYADSALEIVAGPGDTAGLVLEFAPDAKYLINAGSVGQPRDGDPRAGAAIVDVTAAADGAVPDSLSDRRSAAEDSVGGSAGSPREETVARTLTRYERRVTSYECEVHRIRRRSAPSARHPRNFVLVTRRSSFVLVVSGSRPLALSQFGSVRVPGGAAAEDPPDHDAHQQHGGDEDEVPGGHARQRGGSVLERVEILLNRPQPAPEHRDIHQHGDPDDGVGGSGPAARPAAALPAADRSPARSRRWRPAAWPLAGCQAERRWRRIPARHGQREREATTHRHDVSTPH